MAHILAVALTAFAAIATAVTGTWTGTLTPDGRDPTPAVLVLRQEGTIVTGTAGGSDDERYPLRHGTIKDDIVTFEVEAGEGLMRFELKLSGDDLTGVVVREREGQQQKAGLLLKRAR